jgi:predicted RNA-binding Zn-ribbon protein involved in translation (DUF1610 family)
MRPERRGADPSEQEAERLLAEERLRHPEDGRSAHSIYDEPNIFTDRADEIVHQDWFCSQCGYNLRGLPTHHPCPECGHKELYRPAPATARGYQAWLRTRIEQTTPATARRTALLIALVGGLWAVLGAFLSPDPGVFGAHLGFMAIVFGPAVEEMMKIGAAAVIVETRPYLFKRVEQLQVATAGSALGFAVVENLLYLNVYMSDPPPFFVIWRWTVCVALHLGCTMIATRGLVMVWSRAVSELRPPTMTHILRSLTVAIVVHGAYNAAMIAWELLP